MKDAKPFGSFGTRADAMRIIVLNGMQLEGGECAK